jgi:hypothetical protein
MKEIKEDLNKWRVILFTWIGRLSIVKMSIITNPIKILAGYFKGIDNLALNFIWEDKGVRIAMTIMKIKNKIGGIILEF